MAERCCVRVVKEAECLLSGCDIFGDRDADCLEFGHS